MPTGPSSRVLRDIYRRETVARKEVQRRAYLYVARNTELPFQVRHQAQLSLNAMESASRPTMIRNRCKVTGRGAGLQQGLTRFQFRLQALRDELEGVHKASW
ncbi:hypothetical protein E3Q22_00448 [Wallemia mellicola]|uniref:Glucocorticoid receptor-like (DNA-binding domain) n=2 Tax=Wallemia mellicola TaxID=1708541 RepID=A0A4T0RDK1_9BASI|nr:hypothetical protein WALSEDRAFT_46626 [Wallemia mellicola CBS 633.66]TIB73252.1 hypothetical protein E3Q24_01251 [Wallemia mellicola]EIM21172.1 hypothetical protein WALSEDRAFT_46626 [Wallemia mellicola CBS 633.66]TIB76744.1 hypothetical protein E3Q23_01675 [Wallemia mellicola]TIB82178.1 hypothetical protein E3Q22_00448 [Wallemia mellicola]TIB87716.1 hypothetical protein E3Q21_01210 [Wallemia mellicola]|eukprot:XP_006958845.1 hypothetical protein WALSEDRAFT_46626 [Wallemia mellicola CBS 633.66]